ncbi:MAG: aminoacyl-tRNA hydrolase [Candidatus Nanopelagicales bacterium]|nr:aminoacyl-tRNA hydrolase [Candidatus Nanopelagicales bacterium]
MTWLIVGLGNPGPDYAATRHNVGYLAVAELAVRMGGRLAKHKRANALVLEGRLGSPGSSVNAVLVQPLSFMNESGGPVKALMQFYDVADENLIVLHDELDIPFGSVRAKFGGGDNGHNGLKSIRKAMGTGEYLRVRLGIGRPLGSQDPADFVLKPFASAQRAEAAIVIVRGADAVESLVFEGLERTQNIFNGDGEAG